MIWQERQCTDLVWGSLGDSPGRFGKPLEALGGVWEALGAQECLGGALLVQQGRGEPANKKCF